MWRRDTDTLDPAVARELEALETALAGDPAADPSLLALVEDVRSTRQVMDAGFAARLDNSVEWGFPRRRDDRLGRLRDTFLGRRVRMLPALGVAATVLAGITAAVLLTGGDEGREPVAIPARSAQPASSGGGGGAGATTGGQNLDAVPLTPAAAPPPAARSSAPTAAREDSSAASTPSFGRKMERSAELTLTTSPGDVQDVSDRVIETTQSLGGYVQHSQVSTSDGSGEASFTLRLPSARLDEGLKRLSNLAHVGSLTQGSNDITSGFVSVTERLSDARAERRALLRALAKAKTSNEIASLRARLRFNRSQISQLKGQLDSLRRRANFAAVDVTVAGSGSRHGAGGVWTPGDALHDAGRVVEVLAGVALVAGAAMGPALLVGVAVLLGGRALRRRRRDGALDAA
jgi:Domain of unknown function (DUF4349)